MKARDRCGSVLPPAEGDPVVNEPILVNLLFKFAGPLVLLVVLALALRARRPVPATPGAPPPPDAAWLVLMRDAFISDNVYLRAAVDGERVAILKSRRYAVIALRPGPHTLGVNARHSLFKDRVMDFEAVTGEIVVLRLKPPFLNRPFAERVNDVLAARAKLAGLKSVTPGVSLPDVRTDVTSS
jgi:hypothetical protein